MSFIALTLGLAALGVHAQVRDRGIPAGPALAHLVYQVSGTGSRPAKAKEAQGRDGHSGADLAPAWSASVPAPGKPERTGSYRCPEPSFQQGWAVNASRPRPPPDH